jgi:S-adenosylmethionine:tRNA ribosyltransferase-isomerase
VTLHVGAGTFLPVKVDDTQNHIMHSEYAELSTQTADILNTVHGQGGRIIAVGSTAMRVLETAKDDSGTIKPYQGETDIFITPSYTFKAVDVMLTNFHLPKSTLFMLVCAFSGFDTMHKAYRHAIDNDYRFYSYGDACLLERTAT